jgi:hypothetical protein
VGLHSINEHEWREEKATELFQEATTARNAADPNEIVVTAPFYHALEAELRKEYKSLQNTSGSKDLFYSLIWNTQKINNSAPTAVLPHLRVNKDTTTCFYCGVKEHATFQCPSKLIQSPTNNIEKIGYYSFKRIREVFYKNYSRIVNPLKDAVEEERFEILLKGNATDDYSVSFFAFYEIGELFQLCFMRQVWQSNNHDDDWQEMRNRPQAKKKGGELWIGEDCLRVSRHMEAEQWLEKALKESPNDYRPYIALGILAIEKEQHLEALYYLGKSLLFPLSDLQKCYVHLLVARVYELFDFLPLAIDETEKIFAVFPQWLDIRYYYASLLAKAGEDQKALAILQRLLKEEPKYCLKLILDPDMDSIRKEAQSVIDQIWKQLRYEGLNCLNRAQKLIEDYSEWFDKEDEEYKIAVELFQKASALLEEESLFGILDIAGLEVDINLQITNALTPRKKNLKENLFLSKKTLEAYARFLELYPYKKLLSQKDVRLQTGLSDLLENAQKVIESGTPKSLKTAQSMVKALHNASNILKSNQDWLYAKMTIFFTLEYLLKSMGCFFILGGSAALLLTLVLTSYQWYDTSFVSISKQQLENFFGFSIVVGSILGVFATILWLKKGFKKMYQKIKV